LFFRDEPNSEGGAKMANLTVEKQKETAPARRYVDPWVSLRTEVDRLFDQFARGFGFPALPRMFDMPAVFRGEATGAEWLPAVDVVEDEHSYQVMAELPGLTEKDVQVTLSGDVLTIQGEKRSEYEETKGNVHFAERSYGSFRRSFALPDGIDRDKISAEFNNGVLRLTLPKTQEAKAGQRTIEVKPAQPQSQST
jgi:HSP20 family protein